MTFFFATENPYPYWESILIFSKIISSRNISRQLLVITLNCTIHAYLASGQLIALHCQSHAEQTLQKPPKTSNPRPNPLLGALER
jgi:hypothetical protein